MKTVTKIQTQDGCLHDNEQRAKSHADQVYGEALSKAAHKLSHLTKYSDWMEFIDANLDTFTKLKALKDDIEHESDEA